MDEICRFCLSVCDGETTLLAINSDILVKISEISSLEITINENLPKKICYPCKDELLKLYEFVRKIKTNQNILLDKLNQGSETLHTFLVKLRNNSSESKENIFNYDHCLDREMKNDFTISDDEEPLADIKEKALKLNEKEIDIKLEETISSENTDKNIKTWKCLTCLNIFESKPILLNHYRSEHGNKTKIKQEYVLEDGEYECSVCQRKCTNLASMKKHMISHSSERPYVCKICGRTYKTISEIVRHGRAHGEKDLLHCPNKECNYTTAYSGALKEHQRRHSKEFKYKCDLCHKGFQVRTWFEQHQNIHTGSKPYVCSSCGKGFHMERYLKHHISEQHSKGEFNRFSCVHCGHFCSDRHDYITHLEVHGIKADFLCDLCGKRMKSAESLKHHINIHVGDKPYSCSTCGKRFLKRSNLKSHEASHRTTKSHSCTECDESFVQISDLDSHQRKSHPTVAC